MSDELHDLLNGDLPEVEEEETTGDPEQAPEVKAEDSTPESESKEPTEEKKPEQEEESWTKAAVIDERRKRQELERKLEEYESRKPEQKRPDVFEDADGAFKYTEEQINQRIQGVQMSLSVEMMRTVKEDYDEMETAFIELAKDNPALVQEMNKSPNPARFAYETAKKHQQWQEVQNVDTYKAKLREEMRAELEKELGEKQAKQDRKREAIQPTLSGAGSKGGLSADDYSGPTPLGDILKTK